MGAVAEAVRDGGQSVVGVIPRALQPREVRAGERKRKRKNPRPEGSRKKDQVQRALTAFSFPFQFPIPIPDLRHDRRGAPDSARHAHAQGESAQSDRRGFRDFGLDRFSRPQPFCQFNPFNFLSLDFEKKPSASCSTRPTRSSRSREVSVRSRNCSRW